MHMSSIPSGSQPLDYNRTSNYPSMTPMPNTKMLDIPELKKKDDRKGLGFLWPGARLASGAARWAGGSSTWLGSLLLSPTGAWVATSAMAAVFTVGLAGGIWFMGHSFATGPISSSSPVALSGVNPSGIRIYRPQDASIQDLNQANKGNVRFGYQSSPFLNKGIKSEDAPKSATDSAKPANQDANALADSLKAKLGLDANRDQFISKLTGSGVGSWNNLSKEIIGGSDNSFRLKSNFNRADSFSKLSALNLKQTSVTSTQLSRSKAISSRAMGQLKFGAGMSASGANSRTQEASQTYASDAFDQQATKGGQIASIGGMGINTGGTGMGNGVVNPIGTGAPNTTPNPGAGSNVTPWQNNLNTAQGLSSQSGMMKILSMAMIAAGIALIIKGSLMGWLGGWPLIIAGVALVGTGTMMLMQSLSMANQASQIGNQIGQQSGQQTQGNVVNDCSQQASANGTAPQNCKASGDSTANQELSNPQVHQAVLKESNSTFELQGGGGPIK